MNKNNFKAEKFKQIGVSNLYAEIFLPDKKVKVSFTISGTFLSILNASQNKFVDFDKELNLSLEKINKDPNSNKQINLTYFENIGFDDPKKYH